MFINKLPNLSQARVIALASLMVVYAPFTLSRTLIFQSGAEDGSGVQSKTYSVTTKQAEPVTQQNISTSAVNTSSANSELFFMIEQLQNEVNSLRGLLEEQAHELRMLKQNGKDRYLDLDTRILELTKRASQPVKQTAPQSSNIPTSGNIERPKQNQSPVMPEAKKAAKVEIVQREPTASEQKAYDDAYALIKNKMFDESILALFNYTENYPESPLMPNVYYWLGEVYLATSKLEQAKTSFSLVINAYPGNPKVSDSLYKLAVTLDRLGESNLAKQYLKEVQEKYPDSTASKLAFAYKPGQ